MFLVHVANQIRLEHKWLSREENTQANHWLWWLEIGSSSVCRSSFADAYNTKPYEQSLCKRSSEHDTHYRDSDRYQGVKSCNQCNEIAWVRGYPYLQGVREYTDHASTRDCTMESDYNSGSIYPSPGTGPDKFPMDSTDEDANCSRVLLQPSLCRQD